ncbi:S41 family peptidase [Pelomonas sp. BJYL3]|uniref:S41 family peptidase n=1 Tax=Pelomonas sp. BJYL3 TaxID=2976697 RepID=UPI0022B44FCE|nr:S41 family peptidase [Pelomonas sp. BJYL3]
MNTRWNGAALGAVLGACALLSACGGGGTNAGAPVFGNVPSDNATPSTPSTPVNEPLKPSAVYAQQCAPENAQAPAGNRNGSLSQEKRWLRSYFDEAYLWRESVPNVNASAASFSNTADVQGSLEAYFDALRSPVLTASGARQDRFSFMIPTSKWQQMTQAGVDAGFGIEWTMASPTPPRGIRIAYVMPGSPAERAGLRRGDTLVTVNGVSADSNDRAGIDVLNDMMSPDQLQKRFDFSFSRAGGQNVQVSLLSAEVETQPVTLDEVLTGADGKKVGHLVFNTHIAKGEIQLIDAMTRFQQAGVSDLVVDLRYNGGGLLFMASQLAYMVAGSQQTSGKDFERSRYNSLRQATEGGATPFYGVSCLLNANFQCTSERPLPALNLRRVYVLAQSGTCSASEAFINGLRGVDVEVVLIGGKTCGKPYGFTAKDNCGNSYFPIEFGGVNNKGFGDYADGFVPGGNGPTGLPGCAVADDLGHELSNPGEALLATALEHRISGRCLAQAPGMRPASARPREGDVALTLKRSPVRSNAFRLPR